MGGVWVGLKGCFASLNRSMVVKTKSTTLSLSALNRKEI
jgi:hypothetical protein